MKRLLRAASTAPPLWGAVYVLVLAAWAGTRTDAIDADVGGNMKRAEAMEVFMTRRFAGEVSHMKIGVAATAIALGLVIGLVAELLVRLRYRDDTRGFWRSLGESLGLVVAIDAALGAWAMADTPQLYAAGWYARGGILRLLQVVTTDWLGPHGVLAIAILAALVYVRPWRLRWKALAVPALASVVALSNHDMTAPHRAAAAPDARMNVLVLAADSLRADRLDPKITPNLVKLAERSTRFDRAYVSLPRTFPSWVTILTGRYGHHHGIRSMFPTWEDRAKDFDALPERFARAGYTTTVVSDYAGDIFGRIDLGFAEVDTPSFDFRQLIRQKALERETPLLPVLHSHLGRKLFPVMRELSSAADPRLLADDIEKALRRAQDKPFFMTAFFSTAHFPYAAPAPYYGKFTDPKYRGRFKYHKPTGLGFEDVTDPEDMKQIRGLYDGAVASIDDAMGRVLATLQDLGLGSKTIVVITADHGETLFEHGHGQGHGDHLFGDEATHVPLLVYDPREKPSRVDRITRDVDLAPTLYELAGVTAPSDLDGRSLAPAVAGKPLDPKFAFAESELWFSEEIPAIPPEMRMPYPGVMGLTELDAKHNAEIVLKKEMAPPTLMARHRMIRDERYKLIYVPTRLGVRWLLFDTQADPTEEHDIAAEHPAEVTRLQSELWAWMLSDRQMEQKNGFLVPRGTR